VVSECERQGSSARPGLPPPQSAGNKLAALCDRSHFEPSSSWRGLKRVCGEIRCPRLVVVVRAVTLSALSRGQPVSRSTETLSVATEEIFVRDRPAVSFAIFWSNGVRSAVTRIGLPGSETSIPSADAVRRLL